MSSAAHPLHFLLTLYAGWVNRSQQHVIEYLMEENRILREQLRGRRLRLNDEDRRRLAAKGKLLGRKILEQVAGIVTPDTIIRWYRKLVACKYDGSKKRRQGRPGTTQEIAALVIRMAQENTSWGYTRIRDALRHLVREIARNTVRLPARSPNLNAYAERFVLSAKSECLSRIVPLGERHLRCAVSEFASHYHTERHHQGLGGRLVVADENAGPSEGRVACRERLASCRSGETSRRAERKSARSWDAEVLLPEGGLT